MDENCQIQLTYEMESLILPEDTENTIINGLTRLLHQSSELEEKSISLFFCSRETIRELNRSYRNKDKATDILSWQYEEDEETIPLQEQQEDLLGELAVCIDICQAQADASNWSLQTELMRLLVHGFVHLLGYDHEISDAAELEMLEIEKKLLSSINLDGLYD